MRSQAIKLEFHDADAETDTDILATILARMSVSVSWNASVSGFYARDAGSLLRVCDVDTR